MLTSDYQIEMIYNNNKARCRKAKAKFRNKNLWSRKIQIISLLSNQLKSQEQC